ncbi:type II toxin-antitoxin system RelE/ParE family toxin [Sphingomonas qilianensis]|uniref:Type II toxin-antitoxin system RelE/ParE family toxin n=1 Tax=Sphingomonas qilianensis TaxID=1736690 RepID=A0ABU9XU92_9SPHN
MIRPLQIRQTQVFARWYAGLRDTRAKAHIVARLDRLSLGHIGDAKSVGSGVSELRIHYGPGYRLYFTRVGEQLVLLVCGGDKTSQRADIAQAHKLVAAWEPDDDA